MLSRSVFRSIAPTAYKIWSYTSTTSSLGLKNTFLSSSRTSNPLSCSPKILACFYSEVAKPEENLSVVDFDYVRKAISQNEVMIIDVREPDEIKDLGKIPNSVNIPLGNINTTLAMSEKEFQRAFHRDKPNKDTELIFYCMIGKRSGQAQQNALNLGFKNAKNYSGSWTDWSAKNN